MYEKRGWKTKKNTPIKSLEAVLGAMNGICIEAKMNIGILPSKRKKKHGKSRKIVPTIDYKKRYREYLLDDRWLKFRERVFIIRGRKCEYCGSTHIL